jgi:hypothetical protein
MLSALLMLKRLRSALSYARRAFVVVSQREREGELDD